MTVSSRIGTAISNRRRGPDTSARESSRKSAVAGITATMTSTTVTSNNAAPPSPRAASGVIAFEPEVVPREVRVPREEHEREQQHDRKRVVEGTESAEPACDVVDSQHHDTDDEAALRCHRRVHRRSWLSPRHRCQYAADRFAAIQGTP